MYFLRPERVPGEKTSAPALPNRLLPFSFHFFRQFFWGCMGLLTLPVLGRAVFASIAYATKRLTDTVLAMHDPAAEAGPMLFGPLLLFVALVVGRFALDGGMWFCSYHTRSPMLMRIKEEVFGYAQRLSPAYFESTLSGKIAHRTVLLPDQVLLLFDMMWLAFVGGALYAWVHRVIGAGDFVMITALTGSLLQTAYNLGQRIPEFYEQLGAAQESIGTLIVPATIQDRPSASTLVVKQGAIHFERVAFAYDAGKRGPRNVVQDFELFIPPGQRLGLVGPSGAGKTTLMGLLMRMHDVTAGAIRIDGQDIRDVTQASLRGALALIPQDTSLFHRSLLENIRYGRPGAPDEEVIRAAHRAHAHEFIAELEHGYHTLAGERGIKLSGGQRQRIAIARAILRDAPILLLDEATSALDSHSEHLIQQAMREAMVGKSVIAIAHRLSTVMDMDRLIVLQRGVIVADGSHAELLRRGGLYAELWRRQSGGFNPVAAREAEELEEEFPAEGAGGGDLVVERQRALAGHEDRS